MMPEKWFFPKSHPAWGEWIEMETMVCHTGRAKSHPAWGEWIEIQQRPEAGCHALGLTPHGVSELK